MNTTAPLNEFLCVTTGFNVPPQWRTHYRSLLRLRKGLLRKHDEHSAEISAGHEVGGNDQVDVATEESEHAISLAELAAEDSALAEIDAALLRLQNGTYGFCEETGEPISATRLRVIPWTRYSRAAAARHEEAHRKVR